MLSRARPLLGTVVAIHIRDEKTRLQQQERALEGAFSVIAHIGRVMSAHDPSSDLGRLSTAEPQQLLALDAHTVQVIQAAHYWSRLSGGAFHPVKAARVLAGVGARPGLQLNTAVAGWADIEVLSPTTVRVGQPLTLDFGGIAKGYAVDLAADVLLHCGVTNALINAGGDLRVIGDTSWPVDVRHAGNQLMDLRLSRLRHLAQGALATSVSSRLNAEFVKTTPAGTRLWQSASVQAQRCLTADVLTKWALQSSLLCPRLRAALRMHQARMWRS